MNRRISFRVGTSMAALAFGILLIAPVRGYAQTQGGERRDDRQDGRNAGRDAKEECKDAGGKRIDCRQEKRDVKHGGAPQAAPAAPQAAPAAPQAAPAAP
jgi:hypothetical protein